MIRKVNLSDLSKIAKYYFFEIPKQFEDVGEKLISVLKYTQILKKNFGESEMYVLDEGGIKGFLWYFEDDDEYNLEEVFVIEKGRGYGNILMDYLINEAKNHNIRKINMDVHFRNKVAQDFFKKFGFSERTIEMSFYLK